MCGHRVPAIINQPPRLAVILLTKLSIRQLNCISRMYDSVHAVLTVSDLILKIDEIVILLNPTVIIHYGVFLLSFGI